MRSITSFARVCVVCGFAWVSWLLVGCEKASSPATSSRIELREPVVYVDRLDRKVVFTHSPQRIVSISPETTELLFAVGLGERIIGSTAYCDYPEEAKSIPRVGQGTVESISRELIVNAKPDLIVCRWDNHHPLVPTFERLGIPILAVGGESIEQFLEEVQLFGKLSGNPEQAEQFESEFRNHLARLQKAVSSIPSESKQRVFYEVWNDPLMTVSPKSFIGQLLEHANTINIFHDLTLSYPQVSSEVVVERNPDVILKASSSREPVDLDAYKNRPGWSGIHAVRNERTYSINGDVISRCGPRMLIAIEEIIRAVYPTIEPAAIKPAAIEPATIETSP